MEYQKVLIPTDWSDYADEAVRRAIEIPGITEVILLHVAPLREQNHNDKDNHGAHDARYCRGSLEKGPCIA